MTMETLVKINHKIFTIINNQRNQLTEAVCQRGRRCRIAGLSAGHGYILHKDVQGRVQSEPWSF